MSSQTPLALPRRFILSGKSAHDSLKYTIVLELWYTDRNNKTWSGNLYDDSTHTANVDTPIRSCMFFRVALVSPVHGRPANRVGNWYSSILCADKLLGTNSEYKFLDQETNESIASIMKNRGFMNPCNKSKELLQYARGQMAYQCKHECNIAYKCPPIERLATENTPARKCANESHITTSYARKSTETLRKIITLNREVIDNRPTKKIKTAAKSTELGSNSDGRTLSDELNTFTVKRKSSTEVQPKTRIVNVASLNSTPPQTLVILPVVVTVAHPHENCDLEALESALTDLVCTEEIDLFTWNEDADDSPPALNPQYMDAAILPTPPADVNLIKTAEQLQELYRFYNIGTLSLDNEVDIENYDPNSDGTQSSSDIWSAECTSRKMKPCGSDSTITDDRVRYVRFELNFDVADMLETFKTSNDITVIDKTVPSNILSSEKYPNQLERFVSECCSVATKDTAHVTSVKFISAYKSWCERTKVKQLFNANNFGNEIDSILKGIREFCNGTHPYSRCKANGSWKYRGIELTDAAFGNA